MSIQNSIKRGASRISLLSGLGILCLMAAHLIPEFLGSTGAPMFFGVGLCFSGLGAGELALRILQPRVDSQSAAYKAGEDPVGAGLVYLGRCILGAAVLMLVVTSSRAADLQPPDAAKKLLPLLKMQQTMYWATMPLPSALGAQVEQETCITLKSKSCWSPRAELKTSREQGVGLGQLTRAFTKTGATRFDALSDIVSSNPKELKGLSWENRYDPTLQLRALVLKNKQGFDLVLSTHSTEDRLAMSFAAYNGGSGGLNSDRRSCAGTVGCNPGKWFGNVERTSLKSKSAVHGYGKSFFEINREYVKNVMIVRRFRYVSSLDT